MNDIVKYRHPDFYIMDLIILEVVKTEVIPELLVELVDADGVYLSCSQSLAFRSTRAAYHILRETVDQEMIVCMREFLDDFQNQVLERREHPIEHIAEELILTAIKDLGSETLQVCSICVS